MSVILNIWSRTNPAQSTFDAWWMVQLPSTIAKPKPRIASLRESSFAGTTRSSAESTGTPFDALLAVETVFSGPTSAQDLGARPSH